METLFKSLDVTRLTTQLVEYLPRVGAAILILLGFLILSRVVRRPLRAMLGRAGFHVKLVELLVDKILHYAIAILGLVMAADQLGINVTAALAGISVAGIALGFAAQDSVANLISGILIFWDKPFVVGDWIKTADEFGCVSDITLRSTRIRTPRNTYVVIPNKSIIDSVLENYSKHGEMRVDVRLGIAYKEDIPTARKVLLEAMAGISRLRKEPPTDVVVEELGNSSVNLIVRVWIDDADDLQRTQFAVMEASKLALDAAGIQIPFPHLQLFVDNVEYRVWQRASRLAGRPADGAGEAGPS